MKNIYTILLLFFAITSKAQLGTLIISSSIENSDVYINGKFKGKSPLEIMLPPANYSIKIQKKLDSFIEYFGQDNYSLKNKEIKRLSIELAKMETPTYRQLYSKLVPIQLKI